MAKFAKAQGQDLMKQVDEQKKRQLAEHETIHPPSPDNIGKSEMDEMRRILKEKSPRDSEEYFKNIPTESERDSSPERVPRRKKHHHHHRHHHNNIEAKSDYTDKELHTDYDTSSSYRDSSFISSEINGDLKSLAIEDPSKVLDWLRGYGGIEPEKRIVLSEDRILSLLQALREGTFSANEGLMQQENWVPMEKLREAERRSSAAEEQIRYFEQFFNMREGFESGTDQDEQIRTVLTKSKTMDRHFAHMKKFAEDRHADLKRMYSNISDRDVKTWRANISPSRSGLVSLEKATKDLQEHENHKKRLVQVFSNYNELIRLLKAEHAKRVDAENKSFQLTSQLKRQTATLKKAEKVIKQTALSPIVFNESHSFNSRAPNFANFDRNSMQASPSSYHNNSDRQSPSFSSPSTPLASSALSGLHSQPNFGKNHPDRDSRGAPPLHSKSLNNTGKITLRTSSNSSPTPSNQAISKQLIYDVALHPPPSRDVSPAAHSRLPTSELITENHRKEFQELENALIEEGRSKGFSDVDLYSEKKIIGKEETCWEYRHVHFDFTKPNQLPNGHPERRPASPNSCREALDLTCVSNLPTSRRTTSPGRSEGSLFTEDKFDNLQQSASDDDGHLLSSIASYREGLERLNSTEESKQMVSPSSPLKLDTCSSSPSSPLKLDSCPAPASLSLKLDSGLFSIPDVQSAKERSKLEAAVADEKSAKKNAVQQPGTDMAEDDGAENGDLAGFLDDVAEKVGDTRSKSSSKAKSDMAVHVDMQANGLKQMRSGHISSKHIRPKSTSDLHRRVAAIEAGHAAHLLHSHVKRRRRLVLIQVVLFSAALIWGIFPLSLHSLPPPT